MIAINFESQELIHQFHYLLDPRLRALVFEFSHHCILRFGTIPYITHIFRTQEQQDEFYSDKIKKGFFVIVNNVKHYSLDKIKPTISVHQADPVRGIDIRSKDFGANQIRKLDNLIEYYFPYGRGYETLIHHNMGLGTHIHLQVPPLGL